MAGSLTVLSAHRFGRAREELQTAELLLKNANFRSSINRSYYAIFHAIRAVNGCVADDLGSLPLKYAGLNILLIEVRNHTAVLAAVKTIQRVLREQADYEDFYEATQEEAAEVFIQAERFIAAVESYLREQKVL